MAWEFIPYGESLSCLAFLRSQGAVVLAEVLAAAGEPTPPIALLRLGHNGLSGGRSAQALIRLLSDAPRLSELFLAGNAFLASDLAELGAGLIRREQRTLDLEEDIGKGSSAIVEAAGARSGAAGASSRRGEGPLECTSSEGPVDGIGHKGIGHPGIGHPGIGRPGIGRPWTLSGLRMLDLSESELGPRELRTLLVGVHAQQSLSALDLGNCQLADEGAIVLAREIDLNQSLRFLRVAKNGIGSAGGCALADAAELSANILYLDASGNPAISFAEATRIRLVNLRGGRCSENPLDGVAVQDTFTS